MTGVADSFVLRDIRANDVARILKDWLQSYHRATEVRKIPNPVWYWWMHKIIESVMEDPTVLWMVAVPAEQPDLIAGWCCAQQFAGGNMLVHYTYVTRSYRRLGLASRMLAAAGVAADVGLMVTATTFAGVALLKSRGNEPVWNPFLLMGRAPILAPTSDVRADIRKELRRSARASRVGFDINETPKERE